MRAVLVGDETAGAAQDIAHEVGALGVAGEDHLGVRAGGRVGLDGLEGERDAGADRLAVGVEGGRVLDVGGAAGGARGHAPAHGVDELALAAGDLLEGAARHKDLDVGAVGLPAHHRGRGHGGVRQGQGGDEDRWGMHGRWNMGE